MITIKATSSISVSVSEEDVRFDVTTTTADSITLTN